MSAAGLHAQTLADNAAGVTYRFRAGLESVWSRRFVLQTAEDLHLGAFAAAGLCTLEPGDLHTREDLTSWLGPDRGRSVHLQNGYDKVRHHATGNALDVATLTLVTGWGEVTHRFIVADDAAAAHAFFDELAAWSREVRGEVLVFQDGCWTKDRALYASIQGVTFDDVVLAGSLKRRIQRDFVDFLGARERYEAHGVPWKRGVLLIGPPGNGKTHCIKAILDLLKIPCLYVKSFKSQYDTPQSCIHQAFQRARQTTPCVLVLEDLDSLVDAESRAFFLNELDGFAGNTGIITLATTNYPEKLDPAILERPSRFDMKYRFELPTAVERAEYIDLWNARLDAELRLGPETVEALVTRTEAFSFAYIKELFMSALMRWGAQQGDFAEVIRDQIEPLRQQMRQGAE